MWLDSQLSHPELYPQHVISHSVGLVFVFGHKSAGAEVGCNLSNNTWLTRGSMTWKTRSNTGSDITNANYPGEPENDNKHEGKWSMAQKRDKKRILTLKNATSPGVRQHGHNTINRTKSGHKAEDDAMLNSGLVCERNAGSSGLLMRHIRKPESF